MAERHSSSHSPTLKRFPIIADLKRIVLADDNANDIELTVIALRESG